jgi:hypothetical protein
MWDASWWRELHQLEGGSMNDNAQAGAGAGGDGAAAAPDPAVARVVEAIDASVSGPTHEFHFWEQIPAWVLVAATVVLAFVLVYHGGDNQNGWAFAIAALFVALLFSYRSAFSLGAPASSSDAGTDEEPADDAEADSEPE